MGLPELRALLEQLSNEIGVAGRERNVRKLIRDAVAPEVDRMEVDALGNLITFKAGDGPEPRRRVMVAAHMDEVGFMITKIDKNGTLKFQQVGSIDARMWPAKRVVIGDEQVPGVIGGPVPHLQSGEEARKPVDRSSLFVDIGAADDKEAGRKVQVGDYGTFATRFTVLSEDATWPTVRGKAFDDRAGCAALITLLAGHYPVDLIGVFTTQEEMGLRGARVAGYRIEPDVALALDVTVCDDVPRPPDEESNPVTRLGQGPALTIMDRGIITHPGVVRWLRETAESAHIPVQYTARNTGSTDASAIYTTRAGIPSGPISVPCRYIHGPAAILNLNDLANAVQLVGAALQRFDSGYLAREA